MKTVTLSKQETKEAFKLIDTYKELELGLTDIQNQLDLLDAKKKELLLSLEKTQKTETMFFEKIKKTYGEGHLDIYSMKYVTK